MCLITSHNTLLTWQPDESHRHDTPVTLRCSKRNPCAIAEVVDKGGADEHLTLVVKLYYYTESLALLGRIELTLARIGALLGIT